MKLSNYLLSVFIVLAVIFATIWIGGNYIGSFLDGVSLLVILLFAFPVLIGSFGWKGFWGSFGLAFEKEQAEPKEYARASEVVTSAGRLIYLGAAIATFTGFIGIFAYASGEPDVLQETANYSVALLGIFYGMILNLVLIEPVKAYLKSRS